VVKHKWAKMQAKSGGVLIAIDLFLSRKSVAKMKV